MFWKCDAEIVKTNEFNVWIKSYGDSELVSWIENVHEEADNHMVANVMAMLKKDINNVTTVCVCTTYTDVKAIVTAYMPEFLKISQPLKLWVICFGNNKRWMYRLFRLSSQISESCSRNFFSLLMTTDMAIIELKDEHLIFIRSFY